MHGDTFGAIYWRRCRLFWVNNRDHPGWRQELELGKNALPYEFSYARTCKKKGCGTRDHFLLKTAQPPGNCIYIATCPAPGCGRRIHCRAIQCPYLRSADHTQAKPNGNNHPWSGDVNDEVCPACYPDEYNQLRNARKEANKRARYDRFNASRRKKKP